MFKFVLYSKATASGGAVVKSTGSGGGTLKSTSSGGGTSRSTASGGGTSKSTASGGASTRTSSVKSFDKMTLYVYETSLGPLGMAVDVPAKAFEHSHTLSLPAHTHTFEVPNHTHDFTVPNHTHNIDLPNHTHEINIPDHTHEVEHKIVELDTLPTSVEIKVDGNTVPHTAINGDRIDIIDYMRKDSNGRVARGRHEVTITPNGLGRIEAELICRVFIQSQLGGTF